MDKVTLDKGVQTFIETTRNVLQTVYDSIESKGQQKKLLKNENVKALFDLYEVKYGE